MALVHTLRGDLDEAALQRRDEESEVRHGEGDQLYHAMVRTVEYCPCECDGPAHATGQRDAAEHFCKSHIRRDVAVQVLHVPALFASAASLS